MKKLFTLAAAAVLAVSASAQTVTESKTFDNIYVGINGGVATKATGHAWLKGLDPNFGVRVGRYFTPVFGLAVESNAYFSNKPWASDGTAFRALNTSLLGTVNLSNWLGGYKGEPRMFEVSALYGLGWGHTFGTKSNDINAVPQKSIGKANSLTSKAGLDFAFNLGEKKAWQVYIEPAMIWGLNGFGYEGAQYNINRAFAQLNAGVIYKFKNSNGTHNFQIAQLRDQSEIDALNAQINDLRGDLDGKDDEIAAKNREIADLKKQLEDCQNKECATSNNLQPVVIFRQGKSTIDRAQYASIELIANYMKANEDAKVEIKGYASPEGSAKFNQKLSQARAEAVKKALVKRYHIDADRLTATGMGATNKLSSQVEFNRVATFSNNK
ncbi:MAG: OmpA family protein [Prevotella sp.]|nr:OmpA family protein [Prevotella sp.]